MMNHEQRNAAEQPKRIALTDLYHQLPRRLVETESFDAEASLADLMEWIDAQPRSDQLPERVDSYDGDTDSVPSLLLDKPVVLTGPGYQTGPHDIQRGGSWRLLRWRRGALDRHRPISRSDNNGPRTNRRVRRIRETLKILVAALIVFVVVGIGYVTAVRHDHAPGGVGTTPAPTAPSDRQEPTVTPKITSPVDGQVVNLCPPIKGVAPTPHGEVAYWIVLRGWNSLYLVGRTVPNADHPWQWELPPVNIGRPEDAGQQYHLSLVRTDGTTTRDFDDRVKQSRTDLGASLPVGVEVVHDIVVWRANASPSTASGCPRG